MSIIKIKSEVKTINSCHNCPFLVYSGNGYEGNYSCGLTQKFIYTGSPYDTEISETNMEDGHDKYVINTLQNFHDSGNCPIVEIEEVEK